MKKLTQALFQGGLAVVMKCRDISCNISLGNITWKNYSLGNIIHLET